jgi:hypothetical protein
MPSALRVSLSSGCIARVASAYTSHYLSSSNTLPKKDGRQRHGWVVLAHGVEGQRRHRHCDVFAERPEQERHGQLHDRVGYGARCHLADKCVSSRAMEDRHGSRSVAQMVVMRGNVPTDRLAKLSLKFGTQFGPAQVGLFIHPRVL